MAGDFIFAWHCGSSAAWTKQQHGAVANDGSTGTSSGAAARVRGLVWHGAAAAVASCFLGAKPRLLHTLHRVLCDGLGGGGVVAIAGSVASRQLG